MAKSLLYIIIVVAFTACTASRGVSIVNKKYAPGKLKEDYTIFRGALEESHPSLYWFTPKDSMDKYFEEGWRDIKDSMTERQYRTLLTKVITHIRCGHTAVNYSKKYTRYLDTADLKLFPLAFKVLKDTLVITANLNKEDSVLNRGTIVTAINNHKAKELIDTFFYYITGDGYSATGRYQSLSSYGTFGVLYKNIFGLPDTFRIRYLNMYGKENELTVPVFKPYKDSLNKQDSLLTEKYSARERRSFRSFSTRNLQVDTTLHSGYLTLNTFARGNGLKKFFRTTFRNIDKLKLEHLVIDVRANGGGDAGNSTLLTQYLADHKFVIADSLYAIKRSSRYRDLIKRQSLYWLMTTLVTRKRSDGNYHFGYFERHHFKPRKRNHYNGSIYILTGGNSFSATTLFAQELKGQQNVKIIGEETGGGSYGNTAWIIPEVRLPNTKLRLAIPKFRFVMRKELVKEGRGVIPDIYAAPTSDDIRYGIDVKVEAVRRMIMAANGYSNYR